MKFKSDWSNYVEGYIQTFDKLLVSGMAIKRGKCKVKIRTHGVDSNRNLNSFKENDCPAIQWLWVLIKGSNILQFYFSHWHNTVFVCSGPLSDVLHVGLGKWFSLYHNTSIQILELTDVGRWVFPVSSTNKTDHIANSGIKHQ